MLYKIFRKEVWIDKMVKHYFVEDFSGKEYENMLKPKLFKKHLTEIIILILIILFLAGIFIRGILL